MSSPSLIGAELRAVRVRIAGRVQGLGVRPASARLASRLGVSGSVANTSEGVVLELMGTHASIEQYLAAYAAALPAGACVESMQIEAIAPLTHRGFRFAESRCVEGVATSVPCDIVACPECLSEVRDPRARRYRYAFTSCTACGPRYSIVAAMPYDRPATTMRRFALVRTAAFMRKRLLARSAVHACGLWMTPGKRWVTTPPWMRQRHGYSKGASSPLRASAAINSWRMQRPPKP